jgi:hypothetical protein
MMSAIPASGIPTATVPASPAIAIPRSAPTPAPAAAVIPRVIISTPVTAIIPWIVKRIIATIISAPAPAKIYVKVPTTITIIITVQVICNIYIYLVIAGYLNTVFRLMEFHNTVCILIILISIGISYRVFRILFPPVHSHISTPTVIGIHIYIYVTFCFQSNFTVVADYQYLCWFLLLLLRDCIFDLYFFLLVIF